MKLVCSRIPHPETNREEMRDALGWILDLSIERKLNGVKLNGLEWIDKPEEMGWILDYEKVN